jgi:hypothetical protein
MSSTAVSDRPGTRSQHHLSLVTEPLEVRQLLASVAPSVQSTLTFAIGLPIPSLETGAFLPVPAEETWLNADQTMEEIISADLAMLDGQPTPGIDLATPAQSFQTSQASISLPVFESSYGSTPLSTFFGPPVTGPASTLNILSETANAAASEVAQPTPGRSDRISSIVRTPPIIPLRLYRAPEPEIIAEPEIQKKPPAKPPAPPVQPPPKDSQPPEKPAEPTVPAPGNEAIPAPAPKEAPTEPKQPMSLQAWDAAIDLVETDLPEVSSAVPTSRAEGSLAAGILIAAWGGWNYRSSLEGRSRRRPQIFEGLEAGPDDGAGH